MNLMIVGGGGREHAIIRKLKENPTITELYALPGNGGIGFDAQCVDIPAFSVQYHPEAAAGPHDAAYLFDRFVDLMRSVKEGTRNA